MSSADNRRQKIVLHGRGEAAKQLILTNGSYKADAYTLSGAGAVVDHTARTVVIGGGTVAADQDFGDAATPTAGVIDVFPAASGGALDKTTLTATTNAGNRGLGITNRAMGQATALGIPDPGAAAGEFVLTNSAHQVIVSAGGADRTVTLSGNVAFTGAFNPTFAIPSSSTWTFPSGGGTLAVATGAETGTTANTFEVNSDGNSVTISSAGLSGDRVMTFPDATGVVVTEGATQTLTAKTLTSPAMSGTLALTNVTATGTWVDLGAVTTVDINGGTVDGTNVGATTPGTGAFTTLAVGGGYGDTGLSVSAAGVLQANGAVTTDGALTAASAVIGGGYGDTGATISTAGVGQFNGALTTDGALTANSAVIGGGFGSTGVTISNAGAISADAGVIGATYSAADATTPLFSTAAGKTNTGGFKVSGKTSGSATFTTADATAQDVVLAFAAQTGGAATATIIDMVGAGKTLAFGDASANIAVANCAAAVQDLMPNLSVTAGAEAAHARTITIQARDAANNNLAQVCLIRFMVNATAEYSAPAATGTDTFGAPSAGAIMRTITAKADYEVLTDATGKYVFALTHNDAGTSRWIAASLDGRPYSSGELTFDAV